MTTKHRCPLLDHSLDLVDHSFEIGSLKYKKVSGNKKISINKKTGKVTIKKKLSKGTYKVKVKISAAGNAEYNKASKTVKFIIEVK